MTIIAMLGMYALPQEFPLLGSAIYTFAFERIALAFFRGTVPP